jgi:hypothetical protein
MRRAAIVERRRRAWELRIAGLTHEQIAKALGVSTKTIQSHLKRALADYQAATAASVEQYRDQELARIDGIIAKLWPKREHPRVAEVILQASEKRSRLLGLNAPERREISGPGGRPIQTATTVFDASRLSTAQLEALDQMLAQATVDVTPQPEAPALPAPESDLESSTQRVVPLQVVRPS